MAPPMPKFDGEYGVLLLKRVAMVHAPLDAPVMTASLPSKGLADTMLEGLLLVVEGDRVVGVVGLASLC